VAGQSKATAFINALRRLERERDVDGLALLHAQDAEVQNPTDRTPHRGVNGARDFWQHYRGTFKEIESEFRNVVESDRVAMLEWTSRGRFAGGDEFEYSGVSVIEYDAEKIRRFCAYFDPATLGARVGHPGAV
jgi:ketosteroid isomerase-like protein